MVVDECSFSAKSKISIVTYLSIAQAFTGILKLYEI
jgi:hypothetical protein